jgi:hypothetical protein
MSACGRTKADYSRAEPVESGSLVKYGGKIPKPYTTEAKKYVLCERCGCTWFKPRDGWLFCSTCRRAYRDGIKG